MRIQVAVTVLGTIGCAPARGPTLALQATRSRRKSREALCDWMTAACLTVHSAFREISATRALGLGFQILQSAITVHSYHVCLPAGPIRWSPTSQLFNAKFTRL